MPSVICARLDITHPTAVTCDICSRVDVNTNELTSTWVGAAGEGGYCIFSFSPSVHLLPANARANLWAAWLSAANNRMNPSVAGLELLTDVFVYSVFK